MRNFLPRLLLTASLALAQRSWAAGVNFSWNACTAEGGVQNKTFACDTNSGSNVLYGSFVLDADQTNSIGLEATVDFHAQSANLPDWWQFVNAGACRQNALSVSFDFSGDPAISCHGPWSAASVGGLGGYHTYWTTPQVPSGSTSDAQALLVGAVTHADAAHLTAGTEYYAFKLTLSSIKTVGSGACAGCSAPVCITLSQIKVVGSDNSAQVVTSPLVAGTATWQSAGQCPGPFAPRRNITWGQVRSVLR